jgi:hypothetical protein
LAVKLIISNGYGEAGTRTARVFSRPVAQLNYQRSDAINKRGGVQRLVGRL